MKLTKDVIEMLKIGNDLEFEKIYHGTKRSVYGIVFSILKDHDLTNDAMQEVYMKILVKIDQYKIGANFNSWVTQIAKNHAIDIYRKNKKNVHIDDEILDEVISDNTETPSEVSEVTMMLDILDESEREIVVLKVLDELTHREISKIVNKPLGTVLWIYQKAMTKLKNYYGDNDA